jgi:hypothetical protein
MSDDLIKIEDTEENSSKIITHKTLDWWDIDYRPPDYHKAEEFELFFPIREDK